MKQLTRREFMHLGAMGLVAGPLVANRTLTDLFKEGALPPPAKPKKRFAPLEQEVGRVMAEHHMPGMAVGLIRARRGKAPAVKILGAGELTKKLAVTDCQVSKTAQEKIEKAGGSVA